MSKITFTITTMLLFALIAADPALANKFETIGGGVGGISREKLMLLKEISVYAGAFFLFLGIAALLTRGRFEGFIGLKSGVAGPIFLLVLGALMTAVGYL